MKIEGQTEPSIYVTVPMPEKLEMELRTLAARLRISRAELVRQIVTDYLPQLRAELEADNG